jgi:MFS family permease
LTDIAHHDPYEALRIPDYRRFISGGVLSSVAQGVQTIAIAWDIYDRTNDIELLAYTGLAQFLPILFLTLPAGQIADRFPRKHVFRVAQAISALAAILLTFLSYFDAPVPLFFVCLVMTGIGRAFMAPSRASLLAQIVPKETLPNAVGWNSTMWQVANIVGPAIGGGIVAVTPHPSAAYAVSTLCSIACILLITFVHPRPVERPTTARTFASLLAGVRFVAASQFILAAMTLDLFAVLLGGATALLPVYARDILKVGPIGFGVMRAAPAVGASIMAVIIAHSRPMTRPGVSLLLAVAGFGAATIGFGISTHIAVALPMLMLLGALDNVSVVVRGTLVQVLTPDEMRGRVSAVNTLFISSSNELGEFESGMVAAWLGTVRSVIFGGVGTIVVVLAVLAKWPSILTIGPLHKLRPTPLPDDAIIPVITTNPAVVASSGEINQAIRASSDEKRER